MAKFSLSVHNPCSEKWESLQKTGQNGYCNGCEKIVTDFTAMTDAEIVAYFKKGNSHVCGRLRPEQLKTYTARGESPLKSVIPYVISCSAFFFSSLPSFAQEEHKDKMGKVLVKGNISDEEGEALPGATIQVKGSNKGVVADIEGNFEILTKPNATLVYSFIGFETKEAKVGDERFQNVVIACSAMVLGEIDFVPAWYSPKGMWWGVKRFFRGLF